MPRDLLDAITSLFAQASQAVAVVHPGAGEEAPPRSESPESSGTLDAVPAPRQLAS